MVKCLDIKGDWLNFAIIDHYYHDDNIFYIIILYIVPSL